MSEIVPTELELVPSERTGFHRSIALLVGMVAVVAALLGTLEASSTHKKNVAGAASQRYAVQAFGDIAAGGVYTSFTVQMFQDATAQAIAATSRLIAGLHHKSTGVVELPLAKAETATAKRLALLARELATPPSAADGVDPAARRALAATVAQDAELVKRQGEQVDLAERYGRRGQRAVLGLSLAAAAAALLGLAAIVGARRSGRLLFAIAVLGLLGAIASGASGLAI